MTKEKKEAILAEFGTEAGEAIIAETESIEAHVKSNNITHHSVSADGCCNMGCC